MALPERALPRQIYVAAKGRQTVKPDKTVLALKLGVRLFRQKNRLKSKIFVLDGRDGCLPAKKRELKSSFIVSRRGAPASWPGAHEKERGKTHRPRQFQVWRFLKQLFPILFRLRAVQAHRSYSRFADF